MKIYPQTFMTMDFYVWTIEKDVPQEMIRGEIGCTADNYKKCADWFREKKPEV